MSRTLKFGFDSSPNHSRIERYVMRRRTAGQDAFDAARAAEDYARQVAFEVTPRMASKPTCTFVESAPRFGKRLPSR